MAVEFTAAPPKRVLSLTSRLVLFLLALLVVSTLGVWLMIAAQERLSSTANRIHEVLLPTSRLVEQAERELDLQIHELRWLSTSQKELNPESQAKLIGLSPSVQALLNLQAGPFFPDFLAPLLSPWAQTARAYNSDRPRLVEVNIVLARLMELRDRTRLLSRAVKRESSLQILLLSNSSRENLVIWGGVLLLQALLAMFLVVLVWRWTNPLLGLRSWLVNDRDESFLTRAPPRSVAGSGLLSPPLEVQSLVESFRGLIGRLQVQARELEARTSRIQADERASITLFAGLGHLVRHNESLMQQLVSKEKLASMGEMAAQLAHEIRNPLNSLNLKLELLRESLEDDELRRQLDAVLGEIDRLDALTESHLRTTRARIANAADPAHPEVLPTTIAGSENESLPEEVAFSVLETLKPELERRGVEAHVEFRGPPHAKLPIPRNVLKAVLLNLVKNAAEAFDGVAAASPRLLVQIHVDGSSGRWEILVSDNGQGFPDDFKGKDFQAFQTTKDRGSGLGLATSQSMLRAFEAALEVVDSPASSAFRSTVRVGGTLRQAAPIGVSSVEANPEETRP